MPKSGRTYVWNIFRYNPGWWFGTRFMTFRNSWECHVIPTDFHSIMFQRGRYTTNQNLINLQAPGSTFLFIFLGMGLAEKSSCHFGGECLRVSVGGPIFSYERLVHQDIHIKVYIISHIRHNVCIWLVWGGPPPSPPPNNLGILYNSHFFLPPLNIFFGQST